MMDSVSMRIRGRLDGIELWDGLAEICGRGWVEVALVRELRAW